tara:strand:- start:17162 stop:17812 length:651 start_codon:yes stop_codon:yes gene_type:complete
MRGQATLFDLAPSGPSYEPEQKIGGIVCGVDEAGRGPLAGPVIAAAVVLDANNIPAGLNDSKKLSPKRREQLYHAIKETAQVGIGQASVEEIDQMNILRATLLAMRRAVENLPCVPGHALIDGTHAPDLICPASCLVKGDSRSFSIAAASIIAKVERDFLMKNLAQKHPEYGWERNSGYGTRQHLEALKLVGPSRFHRKSFAPICNLMTQDSYITD